MTTLDSALQSAGRESDERRDPREVFREFLNHLGRAARRPEKPVKKNGARSGGK